jgi:predicted anti-sigma-YlaC factor YlaD
MNHGCEEIRTALSARMDGEEPGLDPSEHLATCAGCQAWQATAEQITRTVRLQPVHVPDLTARILAAVSASSITATQAARERVRSRRRILQVALGVSALVQLGLAIPALLTGDVLHTSREAASFDIALAVGFALAAWRPERARAFVPVAFVLAGCLTLTSFFDVAGGAAILAHEISHVAALAQALILLALSRMQPRHVPQPRQAVTS